MYMYYMIRTLLAHQRKTYVYTPVIGRTAAERASENLFCQVFCMCRVIMSNYDSTHNIANFAVVSCIDEAKLSEREERGAGVVNPY